MRSKLEIKFINAWMRLHPNIILQDEYYFCKPRRYRYDFAHLGSKVVIDIQGGTYMKGGSGHSTGAGIDGDCEKLFIASYLGYTVFNLTRTMITDNHLNAIAATIQKKMKYANIRKS